MFFDKVEELCKAKNVKITPLVVSLGMSRGNIAKWREGAVPSADVLLKFAEYFGVTTDYLLDKGQKEMPTIQKNDGHNEDEEIELSYYRELSRENKDFIKGEMVRLLKEQRKQAADEISEQTNIIA